MLLFEAASHIPSPPVAAAAAVSGVSAAAVASVVVATCCTAGCARVVTALLFCFTVALLSAALAADVVLEVPPLCRDHQALQTQLDVA